MEFAHGESTPPSITRSPQKGSNTTDVLTRESCAAERRGP